MRCETGTLWLGCLAAILPAVQARAQSSYEPYTWTTLAGRAGNPGSADGVGPAAQFNSPYGVAVDGQGNLYVPDLFNATLRMVSPAGKVTTVAGLAGAPGAVDGPGASARFASPCAVAVDGAGNLYVADLADATVRKVAGDAPAWDVTTLAGTAGRYGSTDAAGPSARFDVPAGVAADSSGTLYVADEYNSTIRTISPLGLVTTLAGSAGVHGHADGQGESAEFLHPTGVAVDAATNLYVADVSSSVIRKITPGGMVTTLAGQAGVTGDQDGAGSAAGFLHPYGLAADAAGNVYVADRDNNTIRKITPGGVVTTLGGLPGSPGSADGSGREARFEHPCGVAVDAAGAVYVADTGAGTIRKGVPTPPSLTMTAQPTGVLALQIGGRPLQAYVLESAAGMGGPWTSVATNTTDTNGLAGFIAPLVIHPGRSLESGFYRIVAR